MMFVVLVCVLMCSVWVMMNKWTRRLSKFPKEVRMEIDPVFVEVVALMEDSRKLQKLNDSTADYIQGGLTVSLSSGF